MMRLWYLNVRMPRDVNHGRVMRGARCLDVGGLVRLMIRNEGKDRVEQVRKGEGQSDPAFERVDRRPERSRGFRFHAVGLLAWPGLVVRGLLFYPRYVPHCPYSSAPAHLLL